MRRTSKAAKSADRPEGASRIDAASHVESNHNDLFAQGNRTVMNVRFTNRAFPALFAVLAMVMAVCVPCAMPADLAIAAQTDGAASSADGASGYTQTLSRNLWQNEYSPNGRGNWADTVDSAIEHRSDGGYDRIEWAGNALHVEKYSSAFAYQSGTTVAASTYTPTGASTVLWGGYFRGSHIASW